MTMVFGIFVMSSGSVMAEENQTGNGTVTTDMTFIPTPNPLNFGSLMPGQTSEVISDLLVGNSTLYITAIGVTPGAGAIFTEANLEFNPNGTWYHASDLGFPMITIDPLGTNPFLLPIRLYVPIGTTAGNFDGTITYTLMETITP